jgi:uncharacterized protein
MKKMITGIMLLCVYVQVHAQAAATDSTLMQQARQHLLGIGKPKDPAKAMELYKQCAAAGNTSAMVTVGVLYKEGRGALPSIPLAAEWFTKAGNAGYAPAWYQLGMLYKDAQGDAQDFARAYAYIAKAAAMGDAQSIYGQAYMQYKGLGCTQDYQSAAALFKQGALQGRSNSMYFYALCLRNGYGLMADTAQARNWLQKAAKKGYGLAVQELSTPTAENSNEAAKALAQQLKAAALPGAENINQYKKIKHQIPAAAITGTYKGYIIMYDWSGQNAIGSSALTLVVNYEAGKLTGQWIEADSIAVPLEAALTPRAMVFKNTQYTRTDHYNPAKGLIYQFTDAQLQWVKKDNAVFLCGNIQMHSPRRNEPQKPQYVALTRQAAGNGTGNITFTNADGSNFSIANDLLAYPNPFADAVTIDFELKEACEVQTQVLTPEGNIVYSNNAGMLEAGKYTLPIKTQQVAAGTYIVRLLYGKKIKATKLVKL